MNTKDLLKEAIADAKAVRETALAQAKLALEEAFTPRLQSMFAAKLQETMDEDEEKKPMEEMMDDKDAVKEAGVEEAEEKTTMEEDMIDEINLDEILAELDEELSEAKKKKEEDNEDDKKDDLKEAKDEEEIEAKEDVEDVASDEEEKEEEDKEVSELSMDELEELIRDIVSQEMGPDGEDVEAEMAGLPDTTDDEVTTVEEVDLEEILAELLGEDESSEEKNLDEGKIMDFFKDAANWASDKYDSIVASNYSSSKVKFTVDDVRACREEAMVKVPKQGFLSDKRTAAFQACIEVKGKKVDPRYRIGTLPSTQGVAEAELEEALSTIQTLRQELQEVNLLNAKLLYVNKLFKAKNLTESQKIKVVQAFDKAESAKEAKLVYESLNETFTAKVEKAQIKESLGFASKAAGVAEKSQQIVESNQWIARMQKLANIK